ncbi:hypothetical protein [Haemophilus parainfluenzae]|jgi:DNA-binding helix-turn-helix protein|nr:hypothetical protein [Haemophilus parainfluenzae]
MLIEIERLKLALSHANEKEELLKKLLEQKDSEIITLRKFIESISTTENM